MIQGYVHPAFASVADELVQQIPDDGRSGSAVTLYHHGQKVLDVWGGCRDHDGHPWQEDTLSLSFSTTKGVASTLLHLLADRGLIEYDKPVCHYWPEFRQNGKDGISIRHLLTHQAGLWDIRNLIDNAMRITDWDYMVDALAKATPLHRPGRTHGYHGLTYGWLIGEVMQRVTGKSFAELLKTELADPLGLDGLYVGLPDSEFHRRALLAGYPAEHRPPREPGTARKRRPPSLKSKLQLGAMRGVLQVMGVDLDDVQRGLAPKGMGRFSFNDPSVVKACIPSANGMFTARSLARMYAMLAGDGQLEGVRLLSPGRVRQINQVHSRKVDKVMPFPMHWRLGYHRVLNLGMSAPHAFGHFGYQGSGAWCDPTRQLALGFTVNGAGNTTPFGDFRIMRLSAEALKCADRVEGLKPRRWPPLPFAK